MNVARYVVAVLLMVSLPPGILMWFVVHPFINRWRRYGVVGTYVFIATGMLAGMVLLFVTRDRLLGSDLGTNYVTVGVAVPMLVGALFIGLRRKKYLRFPILAGVPELSQRHDQVLLSEGPYAVIRHPRYVEVALGVFGYAFFVNYVGCYVLSVLTVPALYAIVLLEERELIDRFGHAYVEYARRVPRFVPRWGNRAEDGSEHAHMHDPS